MYQDAFPEEYPGMTPPRQEPLKIELEGCTKPVSKPVYCPQQSIDELKVQMDLPLDKELIRPSVSP
jgi:hypothetical protein